MSLPATLYTLAAIGFFALMVNRPPIEMQNPIKAMQPAISDVSEPALTETTTSNQATPETSTTTEPSQDSSSSTSQPTRITPTN